MTPMERILWNKLRAKRFYGLKFRRQVPIQSYVADFAFLEQRVIVELDGSGHDLAWKSDWIRDQKLKELGFHILRFHNFQIKDSLPWVLQEIAKACSLSLKGEGKGEG